MSRLSASLATVLLFCAYPAFAEDVAVRSAFRISGSLERLLNSYALEITLQVGAGIDPAVVQRAACGIVSPDLAAMLRSANPNETLGPVDKVRQLKFPACFIRRNNVNETVLPGETLAALANRTAGAAGPRTLTDILTRNPALKDIWLLFQKNQAAAATAPLTAGAQILVPYVTETVVYALRPGAPDAATVQASLSAAMRPGVAEAAGGGVVTDMSQHFPRT